MKKSEIIDSIAPALGGEDIAMNLINYLRDSQDENLLTQKDKVDLVRDISNVRIDLGKEISTLRIDLTKEITGVKGDVANLKVEVAKNHKDTTDQNATNFRWIVGIMLTIALTFLALYLKK